MSEQVFGEGRTDPSVFDSGPEQVAKKVMRLLGMDDPPDESSAVSAGADFANPLGIPGAGAIVRMGRDITGAGLRELRLSSGEMVRAVRELLEHGVMRGFHGTPKGGPLSLEPWPFHVGTIDAAIQRLRNISNPIIHKSGKFEPVPGVSLEDAQIFPIDVSFRGGLRGPRALERASGPPVMGTPTNPVSDSSANVLDTLRRRERRASPLDSIFGVPFPSPRASMKQRPGYSDEINRGIEELNRGNTEATLYRNYVEDPHSLSMSIFDPTYTNVRVGDPLDAQKLFKEEESLGKLKREWWDLKKAQEGTR